MHFNWSSTASFVALNKRGVKNVFRLNYLQYKIDTASVYNFFCFPAWSNRPFLKKDKGRLHWALEAKLDSWNN